MHTHTKKRSF